jgi:serine/threonine-protein kinase RsbW
MPVQQKKFTVSLNGNLEEIVDLASMINKVVLSFNLSDKLENGLNLILEELYTNAVNYGFVEIDKPVALIDISLLDNQLEIIYRDNGIEFNPLKKLDPKLNLNLEERPVGGLGIFFVKAFTDHVEYSYDGHFNQIKMCKSLSL